MLKGSTEEEVTESLGGPRIIARTIVDAAYDTEDRPDGYDEYGSGPAEESEAGTGSGVPLAVRKTPIPDTAIFIFWISVSGMCAWAQAL